MTQFVSSTHPPSNEGATCPEPCALWLRRAAREQGLIAADTARLHTRMHMIPIADLISAAKLYALLRDADGTHEEPPRET